MTGREEGKSAPLHRAFAPIADEFAEHSKGAGKELGEAAVSAARVINTTAKTAELLVGETAGAMIFAYEQVKRVLHMAIDLRLRDIPLERIEPPPLRIAGPTIEAMKFCVNDGELVDLFANLLVTSMDTARSSSAFPGFVDIIKQLSPDEARILQYMSIQKETGFPAQSIRVASPSGYQIVAENLTAIPLHTELAHPANCQAYLDNLRRLGLIDHMGTQFLTGDEGAARYAEIAETPWVRSLLAQTKLRFEAAPYLNPEGFSVTQFGQIFIRACVAPTAVRRSGA